MPRSISQANLKLAQAAGDIFKQDKSPKVPVFIKLDREIVDWFKGSGPGYQRKINEVLRRFVAAMTTSEASPKETDSVLERAQQLFEKYYEQCFWHMKRDLIITATDLPQIIKGLKTYGGRIGYMEASKLCP